MRIYWSSLKMRIIYCLLFLLPGSKAAGVGQWRWRFSQVAYRQCRCYPSMERKSSTSFAEKISYPYPSRRGLTLRNLSSYSTSQLLVVIAVPINKSLSQPGRNRGYSTKADYAAIYLFHQLYLFFTLYLFVFNVQNLLTTLYGLHSNGESCWTGGNYSVQHCTSV